jgi:hypothetical protein
VLRVQSVKISGTVWPRWDAPGRNGWQEAGDLMDWYSRPRGWEEAEDLLDWHDQPDRWKG